MMSASKSDGLAASKAHRKRFRSSSHAAAWRGSVFDGTNPIVFPVASGERHGAMAGPPVQENAPARPSPPSIAPVVPDRSNRSADSDVDGEGCLNALRQLSAITGTLSAMRRNHCPQWAGICKRFRKCIGGWCNTDINGLPICTDSLSTKLTKVANYRRTLCAVEAEDYLLGRINGRVESIVEKGNQAREAVLEIPTKAIPSLHWADFETLADLIFARSGWRRISPIGGSQKTVDLVVEHPVTDERAAVQVKSTAKQCVLDDFVHAADQSGKFDRLFFVCHSPTGPLASPGGRDDVHLWSGRELAKTVLRVGLFDWVIEKHFEVSPMCGQRRTCYARSLPSRLFDRSTGRLHSNPAQGRIVSAGIGERLAYRVDLVVMATARKRKQFRLQLREPPRLVWKENLSALEFCGLD
jgi:hypothetical protein